MKKWLSLVLVIALMATMLVGCGSGDTTTSPSDDTSPSSEATPSDGDDTGEKKTLLYYTGRIGDFGFGDMGNQITDELAKTYNLDKTLVEYGTDSSVAVNGMVDALDQKHYDYVVSTSWYLTDCVLEQADNYPDTTFVIYDTSPDKVFDKDNVYGIYFGQNEGGFLVGVYSALMTKTNVIGCALRSDTPILNDFGTGWLDGYRYAFEELGLSDVEMKMAYIGEQTSSQAYETCKVMYDTDKIDYLWSVAGDLILGAAQAAEDKGGLEKGFAVIGVDMDQWQFFHDTDPDMVGLDNIVSSMEKRIVDTVRLVFEKGIFGDGSIKPGNSFYGVADEGTSLAKNENYLANTPQDVQDKINEIEAKIISGEIKVKSYFDFASHEDFLTFRNECEDLK